MNRTNGRDGENEDHVTLSCLYRILRSTVCDHEIRMLKLPGLESFLGMSWRCLEIAWGTSEEKSHTKLAYNTVWLERQDIDSRRF